MNKLHIPEVKTYEIFGIFTAFTFVFSIIGGLMADKIFGYKKVLLTGIVVAL